MEAERRGISVLKSNVFTILGITESIRTSLGPCGRDKLIVRDTGEVIVTNDGYKFLQELKISHPIGKLLVGLSEGQEEKIGDGTTSVVVLAGALCKQALPLLEKGIHPQLIIQAYNQALSKSLEILERLSIDVDTSDPKVLQKLAITPLNSKLVKSDKQRLAKMCMEAVLSVKDTKSSECNMDLIRFESKEGGELSDTKMYRGIVLKKSFFHEKMKKQLKSVKIAVFSFALEYQTPKTKYSVSVTSPEEFEVLLQVQHSFFQSIIDKLKKCEVNLVITQWAIDPKFGTMLLLNDINAVSWVSGDDIEKLAMSTGALICDRIDDLNSSMIGWADNVIETSATNGDEFIIIENSSAKSVTILVQGANSMACEEVIRCLIDCICVLKDILNDHRVLIGGGSTELELFVRLSEYADECKGIEQHGIRAFAEALLSIPYTLMENAGMKCLESGSELIVQHKNGLIYNGVDVVKRTCADLSDEVWEPFKLKECALSMATETACMILKIDELIPV